MNPQLRKLADDVGVPLSERSSYRSYVWDGKTLALNFQREIWSNCLMKVETPTAFDDFSIAHEVAHFVVADPVEREFPEWGSMLGIVDSLSNPLPYTWNKYIRYDTPEYKRREMLTEGVLTREEQNFREVCADFLGVYWCDQFGIPVEKAWRPVVKYAKEVFLAERAFAAIVWLRERNLIQ